MQEEGSVTNPQLTPTRAQPTVLGAAGRFWWLLVLLVAAAGGAAYYYTTFQEPSYLATLTIAVDDPSLAESQTRQETAPFIDVAAIQSQVVLARATALAEGNLPEEDWSETMLFDGMGAVPGDVSGVLELNFQAPESETASVGVSALAAAFSEYKLDQFRQTSDDDIRTLDSAITAADDRVADLGNQIDTLRVGRESSPQLQDQYTAALARLVELQAELATTEDVDRQEAIRAQLDDLQRQFEMRRAVLALDEANPAIDLLLTTQGLEMQRRSELLVERDRLIGNEAVPAQAVAVTPPSVGSLVIEPTRVIAVAAALGLVVGTAAAYVLNLRRPSRRRVKRTRSGALVDNPSDPAGLLGVDLLGEIPDFSKDGARKLPVLDEPAGPAATSFASLAKMVTAALPTDRGKTVMLASPGPGDGKSALTANLGIAAALQGHDVLLIDADTEGRDLTRILADGRTEVPGLSDVLLGAASIEEALVPITLPNGAKLAITRTGDASSFSPVRMHRLVSHLSSRFDLLLIDPPGQAAGVGDVIISPEVAIALVPHRSEQAQIKELAERMQRADIPLIGYAYNRAGRAARTDRPRD